MSHQIEKEKLAFRRLLELETQGGQETAGDPAPVSIPGLTVLFHPDPERVGERVLLANLASGRAAGLSRLEPLFTASGGAVPGSVAPRPLGDPHLSRRPLRIGLSRVPGALTIDTAGSPTAISVGGAPLDGKRRLGRSEIEKGVVLVLGRRVVLLLSRLDPESSTSPPDPPTPPSLGMVGRSPSLERLRRELRRLAPLGVPVLLTGESGTGKELAARALHDHGPRHAGPFLGVNLGAVPPPLAAAELFGAATGAFTGADRDRPGHFERAAGGTLFLDEIGEAPTELQALLLRALETGEIQPLGARAPRRVDVRLVLATDADLPAAVEAGRFRAPLLHRLNACRLELPPLRERREDFGLLLAHFLLAEANALGQPPQAVPGWLSAAAVGRLAALDWPGNVRQLRNVVRRLVLAASEPDRRDLRLVLEELAAAPPPIDGEIGPRTSPVVAPRAGTGWRPAAEVGEEELAAALEREGWRLQRVARALGVSRGSLYDRLAESPRFRKAAELGREEILAARQECGGDIESMVRRLQVSRLGLRRRMRQLGL